MPSTHEKPANQRKKLENDATPDRPQPKHEPLQLKTRHLHGEQGHKQHNHQNPDTTSDSKNK